VTGASRGLGAACARELGAQGASLVLNARDEHALAALAEEIDPTGERVAVVAGSVADDAVAKRSVETCVARFHRIDGLVNNAGIVRDRTLLRMTEEEFDDVIGVNLRGTWSFGRHAAAAMAAQGGWITNVASTAAFHGSVGQSNYAASKGAVIALTRAWSYELARYAIRVNAVCPFVASDMSRVHVDRKRAQAAERGDPEPTLEEIGLGAAEDVAPLVAALGSDGARDVTGQVLGFDGRRVVAWTHPDEAGVARRERWSTAELADLLAEGEPGREAMHVPSYAS
jgi:3-oxoacyl-[acyl-carrier protein] reductase